MLDQMDRAMYELDLREKEEDEILRILEYRLLVDRMRTFNLMWNFFYGGKDETGKAGPRRHP